MDPFQCRRPLLLSALLGFFTIFVAGTNASPQEQKKADQKQNSIMPAKVSGFTDSGTFHGYKDEEVLVRIQFDWKPDGSFENKSVLELAGQKIESDIRIRPDTDGHWSSIEGTARFVGKFRMERDANKVKTTLVKEKKTDSFNLKNGAVLFDNNSPALLSMAVRACDQAKGGKQTIPLLLIPATIVDCSVERKDIVELRVGDKDLKFTRYTLLLGADEQIVWADGGTKIHMIEVPSQSAVFVRGGYESLRKLTIDDRPLSKAVFNVKTERNNRVALRGGIKLGTDIYRPDAPGRHPAILIRTPYKKDMEELTGKYYARRGYVVAIQDCRGRFSSAGPWEPFVNEAQDGYDSVEWLAGQPWCNGKVGMIGGSYVGWVQWQAASHKPPHLVTIIPNVSPPDPFYNFPYDHGVFSLLGNIWWTEVVETAATADLSGQKMACMRNKKYHNQLLQLPVIDLDKAILGKENPYWRKWIEHPTEDAYWQQASCYQHLHKIDLPVFHQSGWFDDVGIGSKLNYLKMAALGRSSQKLILGPWGHTDTATRTHGTRDFGPQALRDLQRDYLRWFDHWLKGVDNGVPKEPLVSIFIMNSNKWLQGPKYPLPQTRFEKWFLTSAGKANTTLGDGKLSREPPAKDAPFDCYRYNPGDPTPNPAKDRREDVLKNRQDILAYVSEPFKEGYAFAGPISAVLYAASSAKDTDWFMELATVDENNNVFPLVMGKIRARFRTSMSKPKLLEPGTIYEYALDLWQTGITVPKGHRLRVHISSAQFPLFSRNLNTGGHNEMESYFITAEQTVYHNAMYPSHVVLPAILNEDSRK